MSRAKKIIWIVLLVVLAGLAVLGWWQRDNIAAVYRGLVYSQEELEGKLADNDQAVKDAVAAIPEVTVRDVTDEERQALRDGSLTTEELVQSIVGTEKPPEADPEQKPESKPDKPDGATQKPEPKPSEKSPEQLAYEQKLSEVIAKVYVLREDFMGRLDSLMNQAIAEYKAIPAEERNARLASFVSGYLAKGLDMEKDCDAKIEAIIVELETLLQENNGDMSIAQTVYDTYVEEKSLKKAWYMAELKKRGFV